MSNELQPLREHEIEIRVRYCETDAMGRLHHANFVNYFEVGRTEMMRASGLPYREFEKTGIMMVVCEMAIQYRAAARYDDLLRLRTTTVKSKGVRIVHEYRLCREDEVIATGQSTVACVDPDGSVARVPKWLQIN